ncbi:hypothetical protein C0995_009720 [Termitomyces sp. Mi166|nr:hypothetical protein C0995_009720 [Termitomyces sp. Mi166\
MAEEPKSKVHYGMRHDNGCAIYLLFTNVVQIILDTTSTALRKWQEWVLGEREEAIKHITAEFADVSHSGLSEKLSSNSKLLHEEIVIVTKHIFIWVDYLDVYIDFTSTFYNYSLKTLSVEELAMKKKGLSGYIKMMWPLSK